MSEKKSKKTKIISWNVNGLRALHNKELLLPFIKKHKPDIFCIQETKAEKFQLPDEVKSIEGYHAYFASSKEKKGYSGVAVYSKEEPKKIEYGMGISEYDVEGRLLALKYDKFTLLNVYFPNGGQGPERLEYKMEFYNAFLKYVDYLHRKGQSIIFCGDVNTAHKKIDLARPANNEGKTGFLPIERAWINRVVEHNYIDVFRHFYPEKEKAYTYWDMKSRARERNVGWRIDYFFTSADMIDNVESTKILTDVMGSDHCPIQIILKKE
jgi:exodeoxyribonuclease-3